MKDLESLTAEDLVARRKSINKPVEKKHSDSTAIYVPIELSSVGKLGLPALIHVRDYSYTDALKLASATTARDMVKALVEVIANITEEELDLSKLTSQDVLEILMTVQGTWYSPIMELPYYVDETLPADKKNEKSNISKATIQINSIVTKPFPEDRKVPMEVTMDNGFTAVVDIPRFYNEVIVGQYIDLKYAELDNKMDLINAKIRKNTNTVEEYRQYMEYKEQKASDLIKATQAIQILSVNGKELKTLEERIKAMDEFPLRAWSAVVSYIQEDLEFGVVPDVTFNCTVTGKTITRRFSFRILDFIPTVESFNSSGDSVSIC